MKWDTIHYFHSFMNVKHCALERIILTGDMGVGINSAHFGRERKYIVSLRDCQTRGNLGL